MKEFDLDNKSGSAEDEWVSSRKWFVPLTCMIGTAIVVLLVLITYLSGSDPWEINNRGEIVRRCDAIVTAIDNSDVDAASIGRTVVHKRTTRLQVPRHDGF